MVVSIVCAYLFLDTFHPTVQKLFVHLLSRFISYLVDTLLKQKENESAISRKITSENTG